MMKSGPALIFACLTAACTGNIDKGKAASVGPVPDDRTGGSTDQGMGQADGASQPKHGGSAEAGQTTPPGVTPLEPPVPGMSTKPDSSTIAGSPKAPDAATLAMLGLTVKGILSCPTVNLPGYGIVASPGLSQPFAVSCATCHGGNGQGNDKYPTIPGTLTDAMFVQRVREGKGAMPAFDSTFITDEQLKNDFRALTSSVGAIPGESTDGPFTWTAAKVEEIYQRGLAIWRKPGSVDGLACTNCHSPDGLELAVIGFQDDAILRRAQQHLSATDALAVRDFVHAQRRRFKIAQPCSPDWRPFQPGGTVLPGKTPVEQDTSFMAELKKRNLLVATGKVVTLDDAKRALAELQGINLRTLPIGIPMPRWSEDKFNGPEHRDINDYMPAIATIPNKPNEFFTREDAYLANPSDKGLYDLVAANLGETNDGGYSAANTQPRDPRGNCYNFPTTTTWVTNIINTPKRKSVLGASHIFRMELRNPGSWVARARDAFADSSTAYNPMFFMGGHNVEAPCYDSIDYPGMIKAFPENFRAEFPEEDLAQGRIASGAKRVTHPWMMLGELFDQALISTEGDFGNATHYWAMLNFDQRDVHLPFIYAQRLATQVHYWADLQGTAQYPKTSGNYSPTVALNPLLQSNTQQHFGLKAAVRPSTYGQFSSAVNQLKGNILRMILLLQADLLRNGAWIPATQEFDHCMGVTCQNAEFAGYLTDLQTFGNDATQRDLMSRYGFDLALYHDDTLALHGEVTALLAKAPRK